MDEDSAIAIVGVGCRFPGAQNLDEFWNVLKNGENHVIEVPKDRWNVDAFYDPDPDAPGKTYVRKVGIVKDHDKFDNRLFNINDIEASKMDPQQRFILESTFMALENGGFPRSLMSGSNTGVYIGVMNHDYTDVLASDVNQVDNYTLTGGSASIAAARVSYVFNLLGPALAVDTACSSALIAIHLASQALQMGDCDMAICGGVNSVMIPALMIPLSKAKMVSPTGASRAFSAEADGYVRGEGGGVVVLKRLADAKANGDNIWSIIATGTNQDGRMASPITAPSGQQQLALLKDTYKRHCVNPSDIQYIEAHGTGTPVGDPIEATSLGMFFGQDGLQRYIGSVKTNVGHLESAAGIAGLIKILLMMKNECIVPSLHFTSPNPKIDFEKFNFTVPVDCCPWQTLDDGRRMACVNSFGFGGSNAHAIITQWVKKENQKPSKEYRHRIVSISGLSKKSLKANIGGLIKAVSETEINLDSLSYTSTCRRDQYPYRVAVHFENTDNMIKQLQALPIESVSRKDLHIILVFCGMGTMWNGMCLQLLKEEPFLNAVRDIDVVLQTMSDISLEKEFELQKNINDPMIGPLLLFACQVGLFSLWKAWGVRAHAIVGQSVGEVAAAFASGRIKLQDAVKIIFYRTSLLRQVKGGQMLVIMNFDVDEVETLCQQFDGRLEIAVYYSPVSCAVSGDEDSIEAFITFLETPQFSDKEISIIPLRVHTAYHCHLMDCLLEPLEEKLHDISPCVEETEIYSSVSGAIAKDTDFVTPRYWGQNLRKPVLFNQAIRAALNKNKSNVFVEIGPKPVLAAHLDNIVPGGDMMVLPSMERNSDIACMLKSLCQLYSCGCDPCWETLVPITDCVMTGVPQYQFQRERILYESDISRKFRDGIRPSIYNHPFVCRVAGEQPTFHVYINEKQTPYIYEHMVRGVVVVPGAFYTEVALAVGYDLLCMPPQILKVSCHYVQPCIVQRKKDCVLTCQVQDSSLTKLSFVILKHSSIYAYGHVEKRQNPVPNAKVDLGSIQSRCPVVNTHVKTYETLASKGFTYGQGLALCGESFSNNKECLGTLAMTEMVTSQIYQTLFHPCILDAMTHTLCTIGSDDGLLSNVNEKQVLPAGIKSLCVFQSPEKHMLCYGKIIESSSARTEYNLMLLSVNGGVIAEVIGFIIKAVGRNMNEVERVMYSLNWTETPLLEHSSLSPEVVVMISDDDKFLKRIANNRLGTQTLIPCYTTANSFDIRQVEKAILENLNHDHTKSKDGIDGILFDQSSKHNGSGFSGESLFSTVLQVCNNLKELLLTLSKKNLTIPVTVLTRSTQALSSSSQSDINLLGSQLWGMTRCVLKEGLYPFVQLVDISDESGATLSALYSHITDPATLTSFPTGKEITIFHGIAYKSTVAFATDTTHLTPFVSANQTWNDTDHVMLMKHSDTNHENKFYLRVSEREQLEIPGFTSVKLRNVLLHKKAFFPVTKMSDDEIWLEKDSDSSQVICLEAEGLLPDTQEEVIVCLAVPVSSVITVPQEFVVKRSAIPYNSYRLGLMTLLIIVWKIHRILDKNANCVIITDNYSSDDGALVREILMKCGALKVSVFPKTDLENLEVFGRTSVVLLVDIDPPLLEKLLQYEQIEDIISIDGYHGMSILDKYKVIQNNAKIHTVPLKQCFSVSELRQTLPDIMKVLKGKMTNLFDTFSFLTERHFRSFSDGCLQLCDESLRVTTSSGQLFKRNASYLVVGGLGGLGWLTVRWIAMRGGGLVVIVSRKPPSDEMQCKIDELKQQSGVNIVCIRADISDKVSLVNGLNQLANNFPTFTLKGIFHGAGVLDDAFLLRMSPESFERVCKPKILGTYNLHKVTETLNLDYFVMHSSIVSIAGNPGQSNYGAGNSFMDTFAHYRRSKGLCGQSINWGPLQLGMALTNEEIGKQLKQSGYLSLNEEQIINCLIFTLESNLPQLCFMDFDWPDKQRHIYLNPDIRQVIMGGRRPAEEESNHLDLDSIKQLSSTDRTSALFEYLKKVISHVLSIDEDAIMKSTVITTLGLDSMLAMTLINNIHKDLGVRLQLVTLLEGMSVEKLITTIDSSILSGSIEDDEPRLDVTDEDMGLTVLQEMIYEDNKTWKGERDVVFSAEVYLKIPVPLEWMKDIIMTLLSRHRVLRTLYIEENGAVTAKVLEEIRNPPIFEISSMDQNDLAEEIVKVALVPFNLSSDLPIRVVCAHREGQFNLGFIFHSICFDLTSMSIFLQEVRDVATAKASGYTPGVPKNVNVSAEMNAVLRPQIEELKKFWHLKVNSQTEIGLVTFSGQKSEPQFLSGHYEHVTKEITSDLKNKMNSLTAKWNVSLFQFITSAYHLLLHLISGENTVALKTSVDSRMHIPALRDTITRGVNTVPLIATVRQNDSIQSFITANSKEIIQCVSKGLYPYKWIIQDANRGTCANICRHSIVLDDMSRFSSMSKGMESIGLSYRTTGVVKINYETRLGIWLNQTENGVKLQLDFLLSVLSFEMGSAILESFHALLDFIVHNSMSQVQEIPQDLLLMKDLSTRKSSHNAQTIAKQKGNYINAKEPAIKAMDTDETNSRKTYDNENEGQVQNRTADKVKNNLAKIRNDITSGILKHLQLGNSQKPSFRDEDKASIVIRQESSFTKVTQQGLEHQVHMKVDGTGQNCCIRWGRQGLPLKKHIKFRSVRAINLNYLCGGYVLVVKTRSRRFYFKTNDKSLARHWMSGLRDELQSLAGQSSQTFKSSDTFMLY